MNCKSTQNFGNNEKHRKSIKTLKTSMRANAQPTQINESQRTWQSVESHENLMRPNAKPVATWKRPRLIHTTAIQSTLLHSIVVGPRALQSNEIHSLAINCCGPHGIAFHCIALQGMTLHGNPQYSCNPMQSIRLHSNAIRHPAPQLF